MTHGRTRRRVDGWLIAAVGVAGVVLGHSVAYSLAEPNAQARDALLRNTGHVYWNAAIAVAVVAALWALMSHALAEVRRERLRPPVTESLWRTGARLALLQVCAYAVMEAAERATAHAPVASMFAHHLFPAGVLIQIAVAAVLVQVLRFVGHVAVAVARRLTSRTAHPRRRVQPITAIAAPRCITLWDRPGPSRAPPSLA